MSLHPEMRVVVLEPKSHGLAVLRRAIVDEGLPSVRLASDLAAMRSASSRGPRPNLGPAVSAFLAVLEQLA